MIFENKIELSLAFVTPRATHEFTQKSLVHSVQPFGRLNGTYIRMSCFFYKDR